MGANARVVRRLETLMTRWTAMGLVAAAILLSASSSNASAPSLGKAAPDFALRSTSGRMLALAGMRGHVVVVNFFATWCPPCRAETPDLVAIAQRYRSRGVIMLGVDDRESVALVQTFANVKHIAYPIVMDVDGAIEEHYDVLAIPTTYVLDTNGVVKYRNVQQLDATALARAIDAALAGRSPASTPTQALYNSVAARGERSVLAAMERHDLNQAISSGTAAQKKLDDIANGDQQAALDSFESTKVSDALYVPLAQAYDARARVDGLASAARRDAEQAALLVGQVAEDREQFGSAERAYAQAVSLQPADTHAYDGEYLADYEQHKYATAADVAVAQARAAPDDPESWLTVASANNELKHYSAALSAERHALALAQRDLAKHPTNKHAHYEVGRVWLKAARTEILAGQTTPAIGLLQKSSVVAPGTIVQEQADEQRLALVPSQPDLSVAGRSTLVSPATQPGELWMLVRNTAAERRPVQLAATNVPPKWVLSFCYAKVCDPYRSTITLAPSGSLKVELKVVPLAPTGGPWSMAVTRSATDSLVVGVKARTTSAKISVTGS